MSLTESAPKESLAKAYESAQKSLALDETNITGRANLAFVHTFRKEHDMAVATARRGMEISPGSSFTVFALGRALDFACHHQEAIELLERAIRMNPFPSSVYFHHLGYAYFNVGRYEDAVATLKKAVKLSPNGKPGRNGLIASYAQAGRLEEARSELREFLKVRPETSVEDVKRGGIGTYADNGVIQRWVEAFHKAGMPDKPPLPLPDKPSIAVLPFVNMSDDKSQEFFSDGISEDIITLCRSFLV